jgi:hypothetical protein
MGRIARSFELVKQSYRVLMQDKELMVLPLISGVITIAVALSFFVGFGMSARLEAADRSLIVVPVFLMYVAVYAIGIFFQAAVVAGATERIRGGDPTVGSALSAAARRIGPIIVWAIIAATVGTLLRALRDRAGFIGKLLAGLAGAAWSVATFFVVPVLVLEDLSIAESFAKSVEVFKRTWGETFVGSATLGLAAVCAWLTVIAATGLLAWAGLGVVALAVGAAAGILLAVLFPALQGVFVASLYQFATSGAAPPGIDARLLSQAFQPKGR